MSSRHETPIDLSDDALDIREHSAALSTSTLPNAFGRIMATLSISITSSQPPAFRRDLCRRLTPIYNKKYDPFKDPPEDLDLRYSPYENGQPLHDDRLIITSRIPSKHILSSVPKRP